MTREEHVVGVGVKEYIPDDGMRVLPHWFAPAWSGDRLAAAVAGAAVRFLAVAPEN
jgi:hypothetical protein